MVNGLIRLASYIAALCFISLTAVSLAKQLYLITLPATATLQLWPVQAGKMERRVVASQVFEVYAGLVEPSTPPAKRCDVTSDSRWAWPPRS